MRNQHPSESSLGQDRQLPGRAIDLAEPAPGEPEAEDDWIGRAHPHQADDEDDYVGVAHPTSRLPAREDGEIGLDDIDDDDIMEELDDDDLTNMEGPDA